MGRIVLSAAATGVLALLVHFQPCFTSQLPETYRANAEAAVSFPSACATPKPTQAAEDSASASSFVPPPAPPKPSVSQVSQEASSVVIENKPIAANRSTATGKTELAMTGKCSGNAGPVVGGAMTAGAIQLQPPPLPIPGPPPPSFGPPPPLGSLPVPPATPPNLQIPPAPGRPIVPLLPTEPPDAQPDLRVPAPPPPVTPNLKPDLPVPTPPPPQVTPIPKSDLSVPAPPPPMGIPGLVKSAPTVLAGRVVDGSLRGVDNAAIRLARVEEKDMVEFTEVSSERDGHFMVENLKKGQKYKLTARGKKGEQIMMGVTYATAPDSQVVICVLEKSDPAPVPPGPPGIAGFVPPGGPGPMAPDAPPPAPVIVAPKPLTSPWSFHLEIVDGKNLITAKLGKSVHFRVVCEKLEIQSPVGSIKASGRVKINSQALEASCDNLTIQLNDEAVLLEGAAHMKCQHDGQELDLHSDSFKLKLSDIQGQTPHVEHTGRAEAKDPQPGPTAGHLPVVPSSLSPPRRPPVVSADPGTAGKKP